MAYQYQYQYLPRCLNNTNTLRNTNTFYSVKRKSLSVPLPLLVDWGNIFPIELWLPMCFLPYKKYRFQVTSFWTHLLQEKYAHLCSLFRCPYRALCGVLWPILQEILIPIPILGLSSEQYQYQYLGNRLSNPNINTTLKPKANKP